MADREECVYLAKLAEQAERYDEMVRRGRVGAGILLRFFLYSILKFKGNI
jgi:hypothetical protein